MTSPKQIESNRLNALKSTGPKTKDGKSRSRCNAVRHGLAAETLINVLEDREDYKAFELAVTSDFNVTTAVERELVLRLASLLWRLRRTTAIESGLLQIQAYESESGDFACDRRPQDSDKRILPKTPTASRLAELDGSLCGTALDSVSNHPYNIRIGRCFLGVASFDNSVFEKLNRYEVSLWRQTYSLLSVLGAALRRS